METGSGKYEEIMLVFIDNNQNVTMLSRGLGHMEQSRNVGVLSVACKGDPSYPVELYFQSHSNIFVQTKRISKNV